MIVTTSAREELLRQIDRRIPPTTWYAFREIREMDDAALAATTRDVKCFAQNCLDYMKRRDRIAVVITP